MKLQNLSVRAFLRKIVAGTLLTAALLLLIFFLLTKDVRVVICGIILTAAFFIWGMVFLHYFQKKLSLFTDGLCQTLDHMMDSTDRPQVDYEAETLLSRISHRGAPCAIYEMKFRADRPDQTYLPLFPYST